MKKVGGLFLAVILLVLLLSPAALAATGDFAPNHGTQTAYSKEFLQKCDGQQWFINEIERLLNAQQKTLNTIVGSSDFAYISAIGLDNRGITGSIPRAIGELTNLQYLFLGGNNLSGAIPAELFSLDKLQNLDLSGNGYTGEIPSGFGEMASLRILSLKNNTYTSIPDTILNNTKIEVLNLLGNKLTGGVPIEINNMTGLTYLNLSENALGGEMPNMGALTNLVSLSLWNCGLTGEIHSSVYTLTHLQILDLDKNKFVGELSVDIGNLTSLEYLALSNNLLRGTIPDVFSAASLAEIHLENNFLRGLVPTTLKARYDGGTKVYLGNNYMTGLDLKDMINNEKNFADDASSEQYQLISAQAKVQIKESGTVNVYSYLRNKSLTSGNTTQKPVLNPDEYTLVYDDTRIEVTVDSNGIHVKALEEIPTADGFTIVIYIKDNIDSEYSKVTITLTTDTVASGGMGGGTEEPPPVPEEHNPYVNGYPDGSFRPEGSVTREEVAKMLITALELEEYSPETASYIDVQPGRWSYAHIENATELGYLEGYGNDIFMPEKSMTRAELATCLVRIAEAQGKESRGESAVFSDVDSGAWYAEYVAKASALGLVTGYSDGAFRPNNTVTRGEAVTMINRMLGRDPNTADELKTAINPFNDIVSTHWAYLHVLEAAIEHGH